MKIGFDATTVFGNSGIETYSREIINSVINSSQVHEFRLFTYLSRRERLEKIFGNKKNVIIDNCLPHSLMLGNLGRPVIRMYSVSRWKQNSKKVDLIHFTHSFLKPVVNNFAITVHDIIPLYAEPHVKSLQREEFLKFLPPVMNKSKVIFVPTNFVKSELVKLYPKHEKKIHVVYEAANSKFRQLEPDAEILSKYKLSPDKKHFLYVGRIEGRKNLLGILRAYLSLPENIRKERKVVLVANGTKDLIEELGSMIKAMHLSDSVVHLTGVPLEDLVHIINSAVAFLFPTFSEGFGLPVIEAMQCGCPVITSNLSCLPEVSSDAAILINPYSFGELADAMRQLVENEKLRNDYIARGLKRSKDFSWEKAAISTIKGYEMALS